MVIIYNFVGVAMVFGSLGFAALVQAVFDVLTRIDRYAATTTIWPHVALAAMIMTDLAWRRADRGARGVGCFYHPHSGGQLFLIPLWICAGLCLIGVAS